MKKEDTMHDLVRLKPCPFCACEKMEAEFFNGEAQIHCSSCGITLFLVGELCDSFEDLANIWNQDFCGNEKRGFTCIV